MKTSRGTPEPSQQEHSRPSARFVWTPLILFTIVGGGIGVVGSIVGGLSLESYVESIRPPGPVLSYGQMFGLIIVPLCTLIGAATGFAVGVACFRQRMLSIFLLLGTAFIGWEMTSSMWTSQISEYGPDPSEAVLFFPPLAMCIVALGAAAFICVVTLMSAIARIGKPIRLENT